MAELWKTVNEIITTKREKLTINEIKDDIEWLYSRRKLKMPEIILFESSKLFNAYVKQFNYDYEHKYGLKNECEFVAYHSENPTSSDIERYCNFIKKGILDAIFADNKALICMMPKKVLLDGKNDFHSLKNPAIQWYDPKGDKYYIHGRRFAKDLFFKVRDRKLPMIKVLTIKNIEQRYIVIQLYGIEKILEELNPKLIDSTERGNKLYKVKIDDDLTAQFLVYKGISTKNIYTKFVDHRKKYKNADLAQAESHNMTLEQYLSLENMG